MSASNTVLGLAAILPMAFSLPKCGPANEFVQPPPPQVTVALPELKPLTIYDEFPGRTSARAFVDVRARVQGFLEEIRFEPSSIVQKDQVLFMIEQEPFAAAVNAAMGKLEAAKAAEGIAANAFARKEQAFKTGGVSALDRDAAKADAEAATAQVSIAEANLEKAELDLSYATVKAPMAGRISKTMVDIGNLVGGGDATLLTTIVDDSEIFANFEVTEREALPYFSNRRTLAEPDKDVRASKLEIRLLLEDGSEYPGTGRIDYIDNKIDPKTGTIKVRARFPNPNGELAAGMFVRVRVPEGKPGEDGPSRDERILIPALAVQRDIGGEFVLTVGDDGVVTLRRVTTGRIIGDQRIIDDGLAGTERIIIKGLQIARDGAKVTPVLEGASPGTPVGD